MKKLSFLIIIAFLLIVMAICNPSKSEYSNWLKEQVSEQNDNILVQGIVALAGGTIIDSYTKTHNYVFFSVFDTNISGEKTLKVIGIFNNFIPLDILQEIKTSLPSIPSKVKNETNSSYNDEINNMETNETLQEATSTSSSNIEYSTYSNGRYGFSIYYPKSFKVIETAENGDGAKIVSKSDKAEILVYGSNNILNETAQSSYNNSINKIKSKIAYKYISDNWYVLSWIEDGNIKYLKEVVGVGSKNTFIMTYDRKLADKYNSIVEIVSKNFSTPQISESH